RWVRTAPSSASLRGNVELAQDLCFLAPRLAAAVLEAMTPALADRLAEDVADAAQDLVPWAFSLFALMNSQEEGFGEAEADYRTLREAVMAFVARTDWEAAGRSLTRAQLHE